MHLHLRLNALNGHVLVSIKFIHEDCQLLQAVEEGLDNPMFEITRMGRDFVEFLNFDKTEE